MLCPLITIRDEVGDILRSLESVFRGVVYFWLTFLGTLGRYKHSKDFNVSNIYGSDSDLISSNMGDGNNYPMMKSFSFGLNITL